MTINKFQGKTEEEAVEKAKSEMGEGAVIMNVKEIRPKGLFKSFKHSTFEVTAALEQKEQTVNPFSALNSHMKMHDNINYAADEEIKPPMPERTETERRGSEQEAAGRTAAPREQRKTRDGLEERIENLQSLLEKKLGTGEDSRTVPEDAAEPKLAQGIQQNQTETFRCIKMIYEILLENEVNERYINQILDDVEKSIRNGSSMDVILSNVYQKLVLKFGQPKRIELTPGQPKVIFFVGPTGVGKTTTIAKVASRFKVDMGKRVAFLTADTYRIAAAEQLRTYANILDTPLTIIYSVEEMMEAVERVKDYDVVLVDTAGFSHKNEAQRADTKRLVESLDDTYEKEVYLVLSATTKYKDLVEIADIYHEISDYKLIFTKLDETTTFGNLLNIRLYSGAEVSYVTTGQNVPDDIEVFQPQKIVKQLLGGR